MLNVAFRRMNWNLSGYFTADGTITRSRPDRQPRLRAPRSRGVIQCVPWRQLLRPHRQFADKKISGCPGLPSAGTRISRWREVHTTRSETHCRKRSYFAGAAEKTARWRFMRCSRCTANRVTALLTTVTEEYDRISMHGVRRVLLERQTESIGLPLHAVLIHRNALTRLTKHE